MGSPHRHGGNRREQEGTGGRGMATTGNTVAPSEEKGGVAFYRRFLKKAVPDQALGHGSRWSTPPFITRRTFRIAEIV
jgi:hypothetical protein